MDIVVVLVVVCAVVKAFRGFSIFIDAIDGDSWMNRRVALIHKSCPIDAKINAAFPLPLPRPKKSPTNALQIGRMTNLYFGLVKSVNKLLFQLFCMSLSKRVELIMFRSLLSLPFIEPDDNQCIFNTFR